MVFTSDIILKGPTWVNVVDSLQAKVFKTIYGIFLISAAIGIAYDKRIETDKKAEGERTVPRSVLIQPKYSQKLEVLFQSAIVSTKTETLSEKERLEIAFGEDKDVNFSKPAFLIEFANFGVEKLQSCLVENDDISSIEKIKNLILGICKGDIIDLDLNI